MLARMDCEIAATHYSRGDYKWAAFTLGVIAFSLIITDALSAIFLHDDQEDEKPEQLKRNNLDVKLGSMPSISFFVVVLLCFGDA